jgi:hypothetical protein
VRVFALSTLGNKWLWLVGGKLVHVVCPHGVGLSGTAIWDNGIPCYRRLVAKGDVIAVGMTDSSGRSSLLQSLYGTSGAKGFGRFPSRVAFLKVVDVQPAAPASCVVDPTETSVSLQVSSVS